MTEQAISPVASAHDRGHDDPQVRAENQHDYVRQVKDFANYLKRPIQLNRRMYAAFSCI